jgi:hypothetical protein
MEIGIICSNLIENSHHSSNPGRNPAQPDQKSSYGPAWQGELLVFKS